MCTYITYIHFFAKNMQKQQRHKKYVILERTVQPEHSGFLERQRERRLAVQTRLRSALLTASHPNNYLGNREGAVQLTPRKVTSPGIAVNDLCMNKYMCEMYIYINLNSVQTKASQNQSKQIGTTVFADRQAVRYHETSTNRWTGERTGKKLFKIHDRKQISENY